MNRTKIVATIGPVSQTKEVIKAMIEAGMNVARLNFSHGDHVWHTQVIDMVREVARELEMPVGILVDLQGPRIRTLVSSEVEVKKGELVSVSDIGYEAGAFEGILLDVPKIIDALEIDHDILVEDGLIRLVVKEKHPGRLVVEVVDGGVIKNHKGVNIPDAQLPIGAITEKDQRDLEFALSKGVDFVALSFVSSGADIDDLRSRMETILQRTDNLPHIVAKIERKEAIKNLDDIIGRADAVMVARGDLGIEFETTRVAILQKEIIRKSLACMKPVIVATQMLNSMIENPRPTRAEVSDVTNAVIDQADAVMLSGESASGKYPVESVRTMSNIIRQTEESPVDHVRRLLKSSLDSWRIDLMKSAYELAKSSRARAIMLGTSTGTTARLISHFRPYQPIFAVTDNWVTFHQLTLAWGVNPHIYTKGGVFREDIDWLIDQLKQRGQLRAEDRVVVVMGQISGEKKMRLIGVKEIE